MTARRTVLHVAPHPDDEVLGAGATLLALRAAGYRVVNLVAGLGRPEAHARRRAEAAEAARRLGIELLVHDPPLRLSLGDDRAAAQAALAATLRRVLATGDVGLVVSPGPHDGHHGHEAVARAVRDALEAAADGPDGAAEPAARWWMWGLWADLPHPTLLMPFDAARMATVERALEAHAGEVARNDYRALVRARAVANRVLGPERVFGFGHAGLLGAPYAELLTDVGRAAGGWWAAAPRELDPRDPLPADPGRGADLGRWLHEPSFGDRLRAQGAGS